jgi:putative SOS response-associated peptidase YedK
MCNRMVRTSELSLLCTRFSVRARPSIAARPTWNLSPGDATPVVRRNRRARRELAMLRWGVKLDHPLFGAKPATSLPAGSLGRAALLESLFLTNRCIVPADAFFMGPAAWAKGAHPWAFTLNDAGVIGIAGLWLGESFAIISTSPNESVALMDETMPAILFPEDEREWLDPDAGFYDAYNLLKPFPAELMRAWPVAGHGNDGPDVLRRVA